MYLEEKLMNISKVFQFLVQVYSVESSSFFFFLRNIGVYICVESYGPQKKDYFCCKAPTYWAFCIQRSEWWQSQLSRQQKSEAFLTYYCSLPTPLELLLAHQHHQGLHFSSFHLWNPCRRWLHRLKEILQRFLLLTDANFRFFCTFEPLYQVAHTIHTCG